MAAPTAITHDEHAPHRIAFIVTSRNESPAVLTATIRGLLDTTSGYEREIILIDDGSDMPVSSLGGIRVIRNAAATGVSASRRQGAAAATGSVLVWLDAHMTFAPGWLEEMLAHVDSGSLLCAAYWNYEQTACHSWGADFTWCAERNHSRRRSPGFALRYRRRYPGRGAVEVPMIVGACYMMLRRSYDTLNGFCPFFRVWGVDEQDLSARAWLAGLGVKCITAARVGHLCRPAFPYPVEREHLEFNEIVMLRSVFEAPTVRTLERSFEPVPPQVETWLRETDLRDWRAAVQSTRRATDLEFFRRVMPSFFWGFAGSR